MLDGRCGLGSLLRNFSQQRNRQFGFAFADLVLGGDDDGFVSTLSVDDVIAIQDTTAVPEPSGAVLVVSVIAGIAARARNARGKTAAV